LNLSDSIEAAILGFKTMLPAIIILTLAWALALVIEDLHTADLLTSIMSDNISPYFIPTVTFLLAALVAFSTGSSWGTMAILYPLMLPASWEICTAAGFDYAQTLGIFHNVVACVLAGSVLGDHCSPISDTTILSSLASSCNHINHVRTQMPYALTVGAVAILFGTIPSAFGVPFWITISLAIGALIAIIHFIGKPTETD
jgi:Na+/H+ antiporter NhaC